MCILIQSLILWPGPIVSKVAAPSDQSSASDNDCILLKNPLLQQLAPLVQKYSTQSD